MRSPRSFWYEAAILVVLSFLAAGISNAFAGGERRLKWIGSYEKRGAAAATATARPTPASGSAAGVVTPSLGAPAGAKVFPPHPDKASADITGEDVVDLHGRKTVPFLDARRTSVYREGHIAGARPFSVWEADVDDKVKAFFAEGTDQSAPIVVYCSGGNCEDSHMLAEKLYLVGFDNVLIYKDGYPDWVKRGMPVTKGNEP
jgi:rhodanese-related sulfurtransferase